MRAILLFASLALVAGCADDASVTTTTTTVVTKPAYPPVPAMPSETVPLPPVSGVPLTWQPGHWDWTGSVYAWQRGRWVTRGGHGTLWQDGYWTLQGGQWV